MAVCCMQGKENQPGNDGVAEKLYNELPETSFTRSISNPEAVMRRRRQIKLEKKLEQFKSKDGGPDTGKDTWVGTKLGIPWYPCPVFNERTHKMGESMTMLVCGIHAPCLMRGHIRWGNLC